MMKKSIFCLIACFFSIACFAIEIRETSSAFPEYQGIVTTNIPANDLYAKVKLWVVERFKSAKDVIQLDSPETGTIICKGLYVHYGSAGEMRAPMTLKFEAKDNRYRYTITINEVYTGNVDVSMYSTYINKPNKKFVIEFCEDFYRQVRNWNEEILSTCVNSDSNDDW